MIQLPVNILNFTILVSVIIGITFGILLIFTKRFNLKANRFLGLVPIIISLWNCWVLLIDFDLYTLHNVLNLIPLHYALALGPCIYFYTKYMTEREFSLKKKHFLHFTPVLVEFCISSIQGIESIHKEIPNYDTITFLVSSPLLQLAAIVSVLLYSFYALKSIKNYHQWVKNNYSNDHKYYLGWLYRLLIIFAILWFLWVPYTFIDYFVFDYSLGVVHYYPLYILMAIVTIWISAEAFLRPEIILLEDREKPLEKNNIPSKEIIEQAKWLKIQMETNLFFLNSELTLSTLAKELDIHPNVTSRIINEGLDKSFSDFVNEYRIDAVINRLKDVEYNRITLLGIAYECGFNSKATFNRVFKKTTGKTPFEFRKLNKD
ncbi:helix-turn-helix domain-containing protein [Aquimarina algiphila]|uniref:helix-turn-helix domain-containing protein n=1 Tax=Aquimarina algiphila TaxID=2047982 RepID=UPI0024902109|nr:helix-turn-helix domain-containing protein [Aquimarina algiphila]